MVPQYECNKETNTYDKCERDVSTIQTTFQRNEQFSNINLFIFRDLIRQNPYNINVLLSLPNGTVH